MSVRPRPIAIGAAVLAALYFLAIYAVTPVPDRIVALLGGPTGIARRGGMRMRWRPPPNVSIDRIVARDRYGARISRDEDGVVLELEGIQRDDVEHTAHMLATGGDLEFREVVESTSFKDAADRIGAKAELDTWIPDDGSSRHTDWFLQAPTRAELESMVERARAAGWRPLRGTEVHVEHVEYGEHAGFWRTYLIATDTLLPDDPVEHVSRNTDPYTNQPVVLIDFTPAGGRAFAGATRRLVGHKIATLVDGVVISAPVINNEIPNGRASVTMGGSGEKREQEADALIAILSAGHLPRGGTVIAVEYVDPAGPTWERIALGATAIGGALFAGIAAWLLVRLVRPRWRPAAAKLPGRPPWGRLAIMLLAPVVVIVGQWIAVPLINDVELAHIVYKGGGGRGVGLDTASVLGLGLVPLLTAFVTVELLALVVPAWRPLRDRGAAGRRKLGRATAVLAIAFALINGYLFAYHFAGLEYYDEALFAMAPTFTAKLLTALTYAGGTCVFVVLAAILAERGLGNAYGAILVTLWASTVWDDAWLGHVTMTAVAGTVAIGIVAIVVSRWRVGDDDEAPIQLPASGVAPLSSAAAALALVWMVAPPVAQVLARVEDVAGARWLAPVVALAWTFAFARPARFAAGARTSVARPSRKTWWRAAGATSAIIAAIALIGGTDVIAAMIVGAVLFDLVADFRGRRGDAVPVWPLHHAQHLALVERTLATAKIPFHASATHLRTMLAFFGPWAPILIYVPKADAARAEALIAGVFDPSLPPPTVAETFA